MYNEANPFEAVIRSFYSASFYRRVARLWRPVSLAYLLFVLALVWTPSFIKMHRVITRVAHHAAYDVMPQIPTVRFQNGEVSTPESRPYLIPQGSPALIIIDTSGHITSLDGQSAKVLLTKHKMFIRQQVGDVRVYDLSQSKAKPLVFNQAAIVQVLHRIKYVVLGCAYSFIFVLSYLKRLIQAFFLALLGLVIVSLMKAELDLGALLSLSIVAMTPEMVLGTLIDLPGKHIPFEGLLLGAVVMGYYLFALNAASDKDVEAEQT
jgi:hypothetical protein